MYHHIVNKKGSASDDNIKFLGIVGSFNTAQIQSKGKGLI